MADGQDKDGMISKHCNNPKKMKRLQIKSRITYAATLPVMILAQQPLGACDPRPILSILLMLCDDNCRSTAPSNRAPV